MNLGGDDWVERCERGENCGDFSRASSGTMHQNALECQVHDNGVSSSSKSQQGERRRVVYSSALKSFSFSTWAVSKASLKALASKTMVSKKIDIKLG